MPVELNHTIVASSDQQRGAEFIADILNLPPPKQLYHFTVVELDNGVQLDFANREGPITPQHYAFLVDEKVFDHGFARIKEQGVDYWADPGRSRPKEINHNDGGRGVYFAGPDGHLYEMLTRPYGSGGN